MVSEYPKPVLWRQLTIQHDQWWSIHVPYTEQLGLWSGQHGKPDGLEQLTGYYKEYQVIREGKISLTKMCNLNYLIVFYCFQQRKDRSMGT